MQFTQYKKLQKYYLGSPVIPAEYKKGDLIMTGDFDGLETCQSGSTPTPIEYWVYPKGEAVIYGSKDGFTFTLDHTDTNYYYYVISGSGTHISFEGVNVISGGLLKTNNVTNFMRMFKNCRRLTSLDVSSWNTQKVINMEEMFTNCISLTSLDLSSFNTYKVVDTFHMFDNCTSLETLDLTGWNFPNAHTMTGMFYNCSSLTSLDLSGWILGNEIRVSDMFYNCSSLTSLDLSNWDTSNAINMRSMFVGCTALRTIYMRGCNSTTISKIETQLNNAGIRDNLTIVTA